MLRALQRAGEKSKFGLNAIELTKLLDRLEREGRKSILKLLHFHLGSQIPDIRFVKAGLEEIGRYYIELHRLGFELTHVDVGGGLGVDYDGSRSTRPASMNYTMREYANDVVYTLGSVCKAEELPMPHIISESGRALTAHRSGILTEIDNRRISRLAKLAGAPDDKAAGLEMHVRLGDSLVAGQSLATVHAEAPGQLAYAFEYAVLNVDMFGIEA